MTILQALILGVIQGLTEFLPVSSSGHLILIPYVFGWESQPLYFDVALHGGTLLAVASYFWKDWMIIWDSLKKNWRGAKKQDFMKYPVDLRLAILIGIGTIPAVVFGLLLQNIIGDTLRSPYVVIFMLVLVSIFMWWVEVRPRVVKKMSKLKPFDGLLIGLSQAIALIPGTSRSGITISTGIFKGLSRKDAARFSFLLSTPIILGAVIYEGVKVFRNGLGQVEILPLTVGFITATATGFIAIKLLMKFLQKQKLTVFVVYRIVLALVIVFLLTFKV